MAVLQSLGSSEATRLQDAVSSPISSGSPRFQSPQISRKQSQECSTFISHTSHFSKREGRNVGIRDTWPTACRCGRVCHPTHMPNTQAILWSTVCSLCTCAISLSLKGRAPPTSSPFLLFSSPQVMLIFLSFCVSLYLSLSLCLSLSLPLCVSLSASLSLSSKEAALCSLPLSPLSLLPNKAPHVNAVCMVSLTHHGTPWLQPAKVSL